ncbi:MAG TPA: serine/threonine-protein kinase [Polyangiaceae bacterium]|nr:serine/threonine-protein kinase [Polyangiaceae bacterium]
MRSIPPPAAVLLEPGFRFDGYELLCKIGQGGMASVWLARYAHADDPHALVAIKTILPELAANQEFRAMMLDEARIVTAINHPSVAATLKVGQLWDIPYLVLEYVPGESLDQLCEALFEVGKVVPPPIVVRIIADTCRGLHAAHELVDERGEPLGLVHRDVSPQNILVNDRGRAMLIDFGIAKARERLTPETADGVMKGKIPYMAPEHAMGSAVDRRSDIWSLGAVAYLMLSGKEPHSGPNDAARLIRKLAGEPLAPLPLTVPAPLRAVVERALSAEPSERYATALEFATALEEAVLPSEHWEIEKFFFDNLSHAARARQLIVEHAIAAADARARTREILSSAQGASGRMSSTPGVSTSDTTANLPALPMERAVRPFFVYLGAAGIALAIVAAYGIGQMNGVRASATAPLLPSAAPVGTVAPSSSSAAPAPSVVPTASVESSAATPPSATPTPPPSTPGAPAAWPRVSVRPHPTPTPSTKVKPPEETIF